MNPQAAVPFYHPYKIHPKPITNRHAKKIVEICSAAPGYERFATQLIAANVSPTMVNQRISELRRLDDILTAGGIAGSRIPILTAVLHNDALTAIGAAIAAVREEMEPEIDSHLPLDRRPETNLSSLASRIYRGR